jgi:flagellar hook assembly protein FlgD
MDLQGYFTADFTSGERTAIINALGIPPTDLPLVIFSGGQQLVGMGERESDSVVALAIFPNPFKDRAYIKYTLNSPTHVQLSIYDQSGRQVKKLVNTTQSKGKFTVTWNGTDNQGRRLPKGNYYSILKAGKNDYHQKLTKIT